ncbi:MAG: acetate--CoA ligase [Dongiaceae bacterium]
MPDTTVFAVPEATAESAWIDEAGYFRMYQMSVDDPAGFWAEQANRITWMKRPTKIKDVAFDGNVKIRWFHDGTLNASANCLDRHLATRADQTAILWEGDSTTEHRHVSYAELHEAVCRLANVLKARGVKQGDRVTIYMPMIPEAAVAMLACARIGAIHSVVFGGFSPESLIGRIQDCDSNCIITADEGVRGGKKVPLKANTDEALKKCPSIKTCIVVRRTGGQIDWMPGRDAWYHEACAQASKDCPPVEMGAEDPLFILYTSGSTGKPKGVLHTTGGYMVYAAITHQYVFDYHDGDIYWCTADVGWVTGHSYILYGPLSNGATSLMFEGVPNYPDASRFWQVVDKHKVNIFYTAPTAIRALMGVGDDYVTRTSRKSLKLLGSVGEPINPEAWEWYYHVVGEGRCPIVDTWWQTETGGHLISPLPGATPLVPGSCTLPLPGIMAAIVDETGHDVPNGQGGLLVIKRPWPAMIRAIWGDPDRYRKSYYPEELGGKLYLAGDGSIRDKETGYFTIVGRIDDVLNVSGHRMGTMEIESALVANPLVAEAAVVGKPDEMTGESICAFVVLKQARPDGAAAQKLARELRDWVGKEIGAIAKPKDIRFGDNLPKTRSGKIMRRLLRALAKGEAITQDISTLENPAILEQLKVSQ